MCRLKDEAVKMLVGHNNSADRSPSQAEDLPNLSMEGKALQRKAGQSHSDLTVASCLHHS